MRLLLAAAMAFALSACVERSATHDVPTDRLNLRLIEQKKAAERLSSNPVGQTRALIQIADIQLTFAHRAAAEGETEAMRAHLADYLGAVDRGCNVMLASKRDPQKKTDGFMDLEIAMRRHLRELDDIRMTVSFDDRQTVDDAVTTVTKSRNQILNAVLGTK